MSEEKQIEDMDKEIAELNKKKEEMLKASLVTEIKAEFVPPDPIKEIIEEPPKAPEAPKPPKEIKELVERSVKEIKEKTHESPIHIVWIDNRYHINGIRGTGSGNKIIVRSLDDIEQLAKDLIVGMKNFNQSKMISTKSPK